MTVKKHSGCDDMMDCEKPYNPTDLDIIKTKIINTCAPYELFKNYTYNKDKNKLEEVSKHITTTAKDRQRKAFYNIHTSMLLVGETNDEFLDRIATYHLTQIGCEWCSKNDNLVIDHKHVVSSIYGDKHLGLYRGPLCMSCNRIEGICNKKTTLETKKTYLQDQSYGSETIDYIIQYWYK